MKIKILYNNEALNGFIGSFGFSCFIEDKGIIFDIGEDINILLFNMKKFQINPNNIHIIVLSHEHEDHISGFLLCNYLDLFDKTSVLDIKPYISSRIIQKIKLTEWHQKFTEKLKNKYPQIKDF